MNGFIAGGIINKTSLHRGSSSDYRCTDEISSHAAALDSIRRPAFILRTNPSIFAH